MPVMKENITEKKCRHLENAGICLSERIILILASYRIDATSCRGKMLRMYSLASAVRCARACAFYGEVALLPAR